MRSSVSTCRSPRSVSTTCSDSSGHGRVDRFGNIALNLTREHLDSVSIVSGMRVELVTRGNRYYAVAARTFGDATPGELILYEDSYRNVAIAVSRGSAAALLGVEEGGEIVIQIDVP